MNPPSDVPRLRVSGGLPVLAAVCIWAGLAVVTYDTEIWSAAHRLLPWMLQPIYHDLQVVRLGWLAVLHGGDPLANMANPFNYPRFVLSAAYVGVLRAPLSVLGLTVAACFLAAVVMALRGDGLVPPAIAAPLVICPPVWLMIERGNLDGTAFVLLALAFAFMRGADVGSKRCAAAALLVLLASLLKLYPAAVLVVVAWLSTGRCRVWFSGALFMWAAWALLNLREIALVLEKTTRGLEPAYGVALAGSRYYLERIAPRVAPQQARAWLSATMRLSTVIYAAGLLTAATLGWRRSRTDQRSTLPAVPVLGFVSGASIYAGTFLLGANWAYRLVFLLFCIPLLWHLAQTATSKRWPIALLLGMAIVIYAPFHVSLAWYLILQIVSWLTAWGLMVEAVAIVRARSRRNGNVVRTRVSASVG